MATTLPASRLPVIVNITAPSSFYDQIDIGGVSQVWPAGTEIFFSLRPLTSRTPVLASNPGVALSPPDLDGNNVRYDWQSADIVAAGEGDFYGWWGFTTPGVSLIETPEFPILLSDHGPGLGTETGAIVDGAQQFMPVTFTALQKDTRFGDRRLQNIATRVQIKVIGSAVMPDQEISTYDILMLDFLSKRVALELIAPGIDFWSRQLRTATSSQTQEVSSFPDMIASLTKLRMSLAQQLSEDWRQIQLNDPTVAIRKVVPMPTSSLDGEHHVTRNPRQMPRLRTGELGWGFDGLGVFPFP